MPTEGDYMPVVMNQPVHTARIFEHHADEVFSCASDLLVHLCNVRTWQQSAEQFILGEEEVARARHAGATAPSA
jgi:hypothetical protein